MWHPSLHKCTLLKWHPYTGSFFICCIQCLCHLFPFFEPTWIFSWFLLAAASGPMYSGASAFLFLDKNPAINPFAISSLDEHSFQFGLLKSYNTKWMQSLCRCSQNTRGCTFMLWLRSDKHHISCLVDHCNLHHSCILCTVECFG